MSVEERRDRHRQMLESLKANDIHNWYGTFCRDLDEVGVAPAETRFSVRVGPRPAPAPASWWRKAVDRLFSSRVS
jgi:trehalose-6-phosphate synthase